MSPAQNPLPSPVKTNTRTPSSICACVKSSIRSRFIGVVDPTPEGSTIEEKIAARRAEWGRFMLSFETRAELVAQLDAANLAWGEVKDGPTVFDSPTVAHRGTVVDVDDRAGGTRSMVQSPYRFSDAESGVSGPAPHRGEHNDAVLAEWLGLDGAELDGLRSSGALVADEAIEETS